MSEIIISKLNYTYRGGTQAISNIDLTLHSGSKTAFVGPNGAGKTSLLLAIAGLIATEGSIKINEQIISEVNLAEMRKQISFIFQNPDEMLFMPTVLEDVSFGLETLGLQEHQITERAQNALDQVSLAGFETRSAHQLSYGDRRRVCLATGLARRSALTIFDEPTRELDPHGRRNFIKLFSGLEGTLILASHDLELVLETCEQMILLDQGRLITKGDPESILGDKRLMEKHRLEVPHSLTRHPHSH